MVCSSRHSHVVCPSSLNPHFCIRDLHRPVPVRRRFWLDQVGHVSLEPGGSDSLGLNESLCDVVWRWMDQIVSLRVRALPSRGSTEWRKLCLDFSLFLAGSCSYRGCRWSFSCLSFSSWDETARLICGGAILHNKYRSSTLSWSLDGNRHHSSMSCRCILLFYIYSEQPVLGITQERFML